MKGFIFVAGIVLIGIIGSTIRHFYKKWVQTRIFTIGNQQRARHEFAIFVRLFGFILIGTMIGLAIGTELSWIFVTILMLLVVVSSVRMLHRVGQHTTVGQAWQTEERKVKRGIKWQIFLLIIFLVARFGFSFYQIPDNTLSPQYEEGETVMVHKILKGSCNEGCAMLFEADGETKVGLFLGMTEDIYGENMYDIHTGLYPSSSVMPGETFSVYHQGLVGDVIFSMKDAKKLLSVVFPPKS